MKLINKEVPIDYIYKIEITKKELSSIVYAMHMFYQYYNRRPGDKDNLLEELEDILNS